MAPRNCRPRHHLAETPETARDRRVVGAGQIIAQRKAVATLMRHLDHAPGGVVVDDVDHRQGVTPGGIQFLETKTKGTEFTLNTRTVGRFSLAANANARPKPSRAMPTSLKRVRGADTGAEIIAPEAGMPLSQRR